MPDWRRPEDYAYAAGLSLHEWAWEFARRNPRYRSLWERIKELQASFVSQPARNLEEFQRRWAPLDIELYESFFMQDVFDPDKNGNEVEDLPFFARVDVAPTFFLETLPAPNRETQPWLGFPRYVVVRFDLAIPAAVQAEECRKIILGKQKELLKRKRMESIPVSPKRKPVMTHFVTYIRLLDARAQGASYRLMGKILFPSAGDKRNSAKSMLEAATAMSEKGFRDLLMFPAYPDAPGEESPPKPSPGEESVP